MSRRVFSICMLAVAAMATLVGAPGASAAKKKAAAPVVTKVTPMRISVGGTLTIKGRHFRSKAKSNTVIFRASNGRSAFVKPRRASSTKLVLKVTAPVARLLTVKNSAQRPTRLKLRVLAGKFSKFTSRRLSPVVLGLSAGGGDGGGGGGTNTVCADDSDHDNDLLSNSLEKSLGTDPCLADTDADGMIDGWEYYSAKDLNIKAVPYPGKRPYPNALDPSDGQTGNSGTSAWDFDGDGLKTYEEYRAWRRTGSTFNAAAIGGTDLASPLGYSDGTKTSRPGDGAGGAGLGGAPHSGSPTRPSSSRPPTSTTRTARGTTTSATPIPTGSRTGSRPPAAPVTWPGGPRSSPPRDTPRRPGPIRRTRLLRAPRRAAPCSSSAPSRSGPTRSST